MVDIDVHTIIKVFASESEGDTWNATDTSSNEKEGRYEIKTGRGHPRNRQCSDRNDAEKEAKFRRMRYMFG